ncbi:MAG: hypothetical protein C5S38_03005 [Candidatus Methanophagaceae archaeon]|nr:MAG: hypothetical protein C5S38_03005 [Methanophagales archaeon]
MTNLKLSNSSKNTTKKMLRFENVKNEEALEKLFTSRGFEIPIYRDRKNNVIFTCHCQYSHFCIDGG